MKAGNLSDILHYPEQGSTFAKRGNVKFAIVSRVSGHMLKYCLTGYCKKLHSYIYDLGIVNGLADNNGRNLPQTYTNSLGEVRKQKNNWFWGLVEPIVLYVLVI